MNPVHYSSKKDNWQTPKWLFDVFNDHFNFEIDVCADDQNHLCEKYFTEENSCLDQDWSEYNFMNPPYGRQISKFVEKAFEQWKKNKYTTVALLPARTDTKWFHDYIYQHAGMCFIKGRLKFGGDERSETGCAPFPSMIVIWFGDDAFDRSKFLPYIKMFKMIEEAKCSLK